MTTRRQPDPPDGAEVRPEQLVALRHRLRPLAERLVRDAHEADDLLQETYLAALERRYARTGSSFAWLREILRIKARQLRRHESRWREHQDVPPVPDREDDDERRQLVEALYRELCALKEPYGSTLRLRFLDGVAPRHIAEQAGIPVRTVHTRVTRGLGLLRERMDRRLGRGTWLAGLWLAARPRPGWRVQAPLRSGSRVAWATVVAGALGVLCLRALGEAEPRSQRVGLATMAAREDVARFELAGPGGVGARRRPLAEQAPGGARARAGHPGRVVDHAGRGVPGIPVFLERGARRLEPFTLFDYRFQPSAAPREVARTDADGAFRLSVGADVRGRVFAADERHAPVVAALLPFALRVGPLDLEVAPARAVRGEVRGRDGAPIARAEVRQLPPLAFLAAQERPEFTWQPLHAETRSDGAGRFSLAGFALGESRLAVLAQGFEPAELVLGELGLGEPGSTVAPALVTLEPASRPPRRLRGRVLDGSGAPLPGAVVIAGAHHGLAGADGRFDVALTRLDTVRELWAIHAGRLPVRRQVPRDDDGLPDLPDELALVLDQVPFSIEGTVVDGRGAGVAGAKVWVRDPTLVGYGMESWWAEFHVDPDPRKKSPQAVVTDPAGRFQLRYLLDRDYRIGVLDQRTLASLESEPVAAGARDVVLELSSSRHAPVSGRVLTKEGQPIPGADVRTEFVELSLTYPEGRRLVSKNREGPFARSAEGGWFDLPEVARGGVWLLARAPGFLDATVSLDGTTPGELVEIVLPRRTVLEVRWEGDGAAPTCFSLLDGRERRVVVFPLEDLDLRRDMVRLEDFPRLEGGRSRLLVVPDTARTIVFHAGGVEVKRFEVELVAGRGNVLAFPGGCPPTSDTAPPPR